MKKISFRKLIFAASLCLFTGTFLLAQEKGIKKIHIKVKENDVTTVDTSFTIDEDMDKDEIQEMIHELTGMDVMHHHGDDFIMERSGEKNIDFFVYNVDKGKLDSLKKIHEDEMVITYFDDEDTEGMKKKHYVMKKKMSGDKMTHAYVFTIKDSADIDADVDVKEMEIKVTVDGDGESHTVIHKRGSGDHMKWVDHKSGDHYIIVKEEDGKKKKSEVIIISEECEGDEKKEIKKVIVLESSEKPIHFTTKDGKELELFVKDKKTGTDIALDKVKVIRIETSEDGVINVVVSDKKEKVVKKKKVNKKK
ncbi:MAG: hypothetical protein IMY71_03915 [Bacteroidetes bacterium]|nr:hypothetical protein [Bacteroidota bacterium]